MFNEGFKGRDERHGHFHHGPHGRPEHHEPEHHGPEGRRGPHGPHGRRGGRARRGEAKYFLMDALRDGPKHGYEIIKTLEERSGGQYVPSPGVVYPTLQFLTEVGLVRAEQEEDRRVFHLTEEGQKELASRADEVAAFWAQFAQSGPARTEVGFLEEELEYLMRTVQGGLRGNPDAERVRRIRQAVEGCRNTVRDIIASTMEEA